MNLKMDDIELLKKMYSDLALDYERKKYVMEQDYNAKSELLDLLRMVFDVLLDEKSKSRISKEDRKLLEPVARRVGRIID